MPQESKTPKLCTLQMAGLYLVSEDKYSLIFGGVSGVGW